MEVLLDRSDNIPASDVKGAEYLIVLKASDWGKEKAELHREVQIDGNYMEKLYKQWFLNL